MEWVNDVECALLIGAVPPFKREDEEAWYNRYRASRGNKGFTIVEKATSMPVGVATLDNILFNHRSATLGLILRKGSRRKGYGREAVALLVDYAFNVLNLNRLEGHVFDFNGATSAIAASLGFRIVGTLRQSVFAGGRYHDAMAYDLLAEEYRKGRTPSSVCDLVAQHQLRARRSAPRETVRTTGKGRARGLT
ncbi:MAG: GNAT family protein [Planctomycetota bacterium]|nr:GNAT family protein [Planctomycetota bacterium]